MIIRLALEAMGTRFELVLCGEHEPLLRAAGEEAIEAILEEHHRLSVFAAGSQIARVNAKATEQPVGVDADLFALLKLGERVWEESEGAFDPAVGGLMQKWGHRGDPGGRDTRPTGGEVGGEEVGFAGVVLDQEAETVAFTQPEIGIDLGGIAKGYTLDKAAAIVREAGVDSGLLHGGTSSIVAIGSPPEEVGWRVKLGCLAAAETPTELVLRDVALSVSAPEGRVSTTGAVHIIDPRTGHPAKTARPAIACGASGALADAWATALVVLGGRPDRMPTEIGSAVLTAEGWNISPAMEPVFG